MRKLMGLLLIICMVAFNSMAFAGETDNGRVVGDDIEIGEDEVKIVSLEGETGSVVGDDIEVGEGEFKIISINDEDLESDAVVGDDIEIGEGEFKIISIDEGQEDEGKNSLVWPIAGGSGALLLITAVILLVKSKK